MKGRIGMRYGCFWKANATSGLEQISTDGSLTSEGTISSSGDSSSGRKSDVVTSSDRRGILGDALLTLRSTSLTCKLFPDLISLITRSTTLSLLPPLLGIPDLAAYPKITVSSDCTILPLPPRAPAQKPPSLVQPAARLPPRASAYTFFCRAAAKVTFPIGATPASPPASIRGFDSSSLDLSVPVDVSVFTIDRKIARHDIDKEVNRTLTREIKSILVSSFSSNPA